MSKPLVIACEIEDHHEPLVLITVDTRTIGERHVCVNMKPIDDSIIGDAIDDQAATEIAYAVALACARMAARLRGVRPS